MFKKYILVLLIVILTLTFPFKSFSDPTEYIIKPQDTLEITVYNEADLSAIVKVSGDGHITYPLIGKVKVGDLTITEAQILLTELFAKDYLVDPHVSVAVKDFSKIYIYGEVKSPGVYPLEGNLTVVEAITKAGGFTKIAAINSTKVVRVEDGKEKNIPIKITAITRKGDKSKDIYLKPGDVIVVPESFF